MKTVWPLWTAMLIQALQWRWRIGVEEGVEHRHRDHPRDVQVIGGEDDPVGQPVTVAEGAVHAGQQEAAEQGSSPMTVLRTICTSTRANQPHAPCMKSWPAVLSRNEPKS